MKPPRYTHGYIDRHGKPRWYLRRAGRKSLPLPGLPWSPQFMAAYESAMKGGWEVPQIGASRTVPGTVNAELVSYYGSADFAALSEGTQKSRRAILERFREEHGQRPIKIDPAALLRILTRKKPFAARNWLKAIRGLLAYAVATGALESDPTKDLKLPKAPKSDGFHCWTEDEMARYRATHAPGTRARLAFELLLGTGLARADAVRLGQQHVKEEMLTMRRKKTGTPADVPIVPELREALALVPRTQLTFLLTQFGKPFTAAGFGGWFREQCDVAGLTNCAAHGLRKAAATRLAELGATAHQLMAWFGWKSIREAERYTRAANNKRLAAEAAKLIARTASG